VLGIVAAVPILADDSADAMKIPSEAELPEWSIGLPDIELLRKLWHLAESNYGKIKLVRAMEHLERVHDEERSRMPEGPGCIVFCDSFEPVDDIGKRWPR
jgi:hypothetical protein